MDGLTTRGELIPLYPDRPRVDGLDLWVSLARLCQITSLDLDPLPHLQIKDRDRKPTIEGWADTESWTIQINTWPGLRWYEVEETLLHEVVHLAVSLYHGEGFKRALLRAAWDHVGEAGQGLLPPPGEVPRRCSDLDETVTCALRCAGPPRHRQPVSWTQAASREWARIEHWIGRLRHG